MTTTLRERRERREAMTGGRQQFVSRPPVMGPATAAVRSSRAVGARGAVPAELLAMQLHLLRLKAG